jgi:lipopolysaccharide export system permease protein
MKLIDKYLLRQLLVPLFYCLMGFVMIFVIHDLFGHLDDFVEASTNPVDIVKYYFILVPSLLNHIAPTALLLAVLYSLSLLTKNNELTAMRASGVSLYRLLVPFIAVGALFSVAVFYINERVGPNNAYWCDQFIRGLKYREAPDLHLVRNHPLKNEVGHRIWLVREFNKVTYEMKGVQMIQERDDGSYETEYNAESASWMDNLWWFENVSIQKYDENSNPMGRPAERRAMEIPNLTESPKEFLADMREDQTFMSAAEIAAFVRSHPNLSDRSSARYLTDFHYRLATPWTCLILTLLGIPMGGKTGRSGAFIGVFLSVGLFFLYYVLITFFINLGKSGGLAPMAAAWIPNLIFLILGIVFVYRMR